MRRSLLLAWRSTAKPAAAPHADGGAIGPHPTSSSRGAKSWGHWFRRAQSAERPLHSDVLLPQSPTCWAIGLHV